MTKTSFWRGWATRFSLALVALLAFGQLAVAQDATPASGSPTAAEMEGDALVRGLDPEALPDGWQTPESITHVVNYLVHEWYQNMTKAEQARADEYGIEFSLIDANLDLQKSLAGVDDATAKDSSVLIFTPVNEEASGPKISEASESGVPVVCQASPTDGCLTLLTGDDYGAAFDVGVWAGNYVAENLGGTARILDVGLPALSTTVARSQGFMDGITSVLGDNAILTQSVDGNGLKDVSVSVAADALTAHPDVNVIFGINDDSALGALQSYEAAGLDTENLLVVGFGCEGNACKDALMEGGPYKVSAALFPEYQGRLIIDASVAAFNGVDLPPMLLAPAAPMTAENLSQFYDNADGSYTANLDAIAALPIVMREPSN